MELRQLKYLLAASRTGQITRAAELLDVSQAAVSLSVGRLEQELGQKLLHKKGRGVALTPVGERFAALIAPHVSGLDAAFEQIASLNRSEPYTVKVSVEAPDFVSELECLYSARAPRARFFQSLDTTAAAREKLRCGTVDFCLSMEPIYEPDVRCDLLLREKVLVQLSAAHPLAGRSSLRLSELRDTPFVSFGADYGFRRWTDALCSQAGFRPSVNFEVCDPQSLMKLVLATNSAAFIARSTWEQNAGPSGNKTLSDSAVRTIELADDFCERSVYLCRSTRRTLSADALAFYDFAMAFAAAAKRLGRMPIENEF